MKPPTANMTSAVDAVSFSLGYSILTSLSLGGIVRFERFLESPCSAAFVVLFFFASATPGLCPHSHRGRGRPRSCCLAAGCRGASPHSRRRHLSTGPPVIRAPELLADATPDAALPSPPTPPSRPPVLLLLLPLMRYEVGGLRRWALAGGRRASSPRDELP
jgi:hypothetical protein